MTETIVPQEEREVYRGEWFVGGFEAKAVAWGLALLAIGAVFFVGALSRLRQSLR